jgi:hypothetical protein
MAEGSVNYTRKESLYGSERQINLNKMFENL